MDLKRTTFLNSAQLVVTPHLYRESDRKWNVGGRQTHSVLTVGSDMNRSAVVGLAFLVPLLSFAQQPVPKDAALPSLAPERMRRNRDGARSRWHLHHAPGG